MVASILARFFCLETAKAVEEAQIQLPCECCWKTGHPKGINMSLVRQREVVISKHNDTESPSFWSVHLLFPYFACKTLMTFQDEEHVFVGKLLLVLAKKCSAKGKGNK